MTHSNTIEVAAFVGIDWADRKHDICLQAAGEAKVEHRVIQLRRCRASITVLRKKAAGSFAPVVRVQHMAGTAAAAREGTLG